MRLIKMLLYTARMRENNKTNNNMRQKKETAEKQRLHNVRAQQPNGIVNEIV